MSFIRRLLHHGGGVQAVWSIGHGVEGDAREAGRLEILVFADRATLERLRECGDLHDADIALFVVTDGDSFESAWGAQRPGSLARWAWREGTHGQAYYDESHWSAARDEAGAVVRVRRRAKLLWERPALQSTM